MALQMTCPYCKKEFPYNNGKLDAEISKIGQRINAINKEIVEIKHGKKTKETWERRKRLTEELVYLQEKVSGLKAVRKAGDQQIKEYEHQLLKDAIKERLGEKEYMKMVTEIEKELEAYQISGLMRHEYTRSNSKADVISVNKLR